MTRRKVEEPGEPCRYKVGRTYAIQSGRGGHELARILITHVRREPLGAILEEEARAEGYDSREEFFEAWERLHGYCSPEREVWAIEFEWVSTEDES